MTSKFYSFVVAVTDRFKRMIFYPLKEVSCAKIWPQNNIFKTEIENKFSSRFVRKVAKASAASVTRFGEISPFWKKYLTVFGNFSKVLFRIWNYFERAWAKNCHRAKFHCCKWPNIEKLIYPSGHTAAY